MTACLSPEPEPRLPAPVEVGGLSDDCLQDELTVLAGLTTAASHRMLTLLREFDARGTWAEGGFLTTAGWVAFMTSLNIASAREKVRVARALGGLPLTDDALRRAKISYSKARAITRIATPENERLLLTIAFNGTTHQLETFVRRYRKCRNAEDLQRARERADGSLGSRYGYEGPRARSFDLARKRGRAGRGR